MPKAKKSLLINPFDIETVPQEHGHLGLEYIASYQESKGQSSEIIDANFLGWGPDILAREVKKRNPDVIGISFFKRGLEMNLRLAARIKKESENPNIHITAGGLFASLHAETLLKRYPVLDSIVLYDGEETFTDLVSSLSFRRPLSDVKGIFYREGKIIKKNPLRMPILDLNNLPYPKRILLPGQDALAVMASRGCYGRCKFCSTNAFNAHMGAPKVRFRNVNNVLAELKYLFSKYGIERIWFNDANLCAPNSVQPGWIEDLAQGIIDEKLPLKIFMLCRANDVTRKRFDLLKRAGLQRVAIGFESIHSRVLKYLQKDTSPEINCRAFAILQSLNIQVLSAYIMFDPYSTLEEIEKSIDFLVLFHPHFPFYRTVTSRNRLIVYENTEMYDACLKDGLLTDNPYGYNFIQPKMEELWKMLLFWQKHSHNLHRYGRMEEQCKNRKLASFQKILYDLCIQYLNIDEAFFRQAVAMAGEGIKARSKRFQEEVKVYLDQIEAVSCRLKKITAILEERYGIYVWAQEYYQKKKKVSSFIN